MNDEICKNFATKLKQIRKAKKISQGKLSVDAECAKSYIGMIENGKRIPNLKMIAKFSRALKIHIKEFFDFEYNFEEEFWDE